MAERPPVGATFEVRPVGRPRSRGSFAAAAWLLVLAVVIGLAALGRQESAPIPAIAEASVESPVPIAAPIPRGPGRTAGVAIVDPIELLEPAIGPITLTTRSLFVYGTVGSTVSRVDVGLEGSDDRVLEQVTVEIHRLDREFASTGGASFRTDLAIPDPAPNSTMWVFVAVYDSTGAALGFENREFKVRSINGA